MKHFRMFPALGFGARIPPTGQVNPPMPSFCSLQIQSFRFPTSSFSPWTPASRTARASTGCLPPTTTPYTTSSSTVPPTSPQ